MFADGNRRLDAARMPSSSRHGHLPALRDAPDGKFDTVGLRLGHVAISYRLQEAIIRDDLGRALRHRRGRLRVVTGAICEAAPGSFLVVAKVCPQLSQR